MMKYFLVLALCVASVSTGQSMFDSLWDETDEMEDDGYLYAPSQSLRRARLSAVPTVIYRHEHAQLTQVWNGKRKKQAGIKSWYSSFIEINAIDLEYSQDIFGRPPVRAAKAAVCTPATITETTEFVLNKCIVANCEEGARCAMFAQMYTLGYNGDPKVLKTTEYYYGASEDPLPLNPCSTAVQRTPWYTSRPLGTLGVQGCTVDELHISNAAVGRFNYCQWNTDRPDLSSACILKAAQSPQGFSKCRGANPDEREAKTQCRTGRRKKPCGCFTAVSWSTSATQARL